MSLDDVNIRNPKATSAERGALDFCNQLVQADFRTRLLEFTREMSQSKWNNQLAYLAPDGLSSSVEDGKDNDRVLAIKNLMDNIQKYDLPQDKLRLFIKIWDIVSLAALVEPYWEEHCKRYKVKHKTPGTFANWAHYTWTTDWIRTMRKNNWPNMEEVVAGEWAKKMVEDRYWRQWCNTLSSGSDINHRGALLLISVAMETEMKQDNRIGPSELIFKAEELKDKALSWTEKYLSTAQPRIRETAKMLNDWALQMYQKRLDKQGLEDFETSLRKIERETQSDANAESEVDGDL